MGEDNHDSRSEDNRKIAFEIIELLEKNMGFKIRELFDSDKTAHEIRCEFRKRVIARTQERIDKDEPSDEWPHAGKERDAKKALGLASDINIVPNVSVLEKNYNILKTYEGQTQVDYVRRVSNGLALIKDGQSAGEVAAEIIGSGLASFAVAMIWATVKALRGGAVFRTALVTGVRAMGSASVVAGVAALIISEILLYLIIGNKKQFLGLTFNNTDLNLVVDDWRSGTGGQNKGDLFVATGSVTSWMEQHENEHYDSPLIQIGARMIIGPNDPDNLILGGFFFGEKNVGLYGTEGVMIFHNLNQDLPRFPLLFACPYVMDNGVNVAIDKTKRSAKDAYDNLYGSRDLYKQAKDQGYTFTARTAFKTGGQTMGLMWLDKD